MHILFLTDNFPPEGNAPASRTYEHAIRWVQLGSSVTVITCAPNFPEGKVFSGYENSFYKRSIVDGIDVVRVKTYITSNEGFLRRTLDYMSFMVSGFLAGLFQRKPDVVVATSPQFFCACAGWALAAVRRKPFVFELRDIWPASITAVGAMKDSKIIRLLEKVELFLYHRANLIISVTKSFKSELIRRGISEEKIKIVLNGVDLLKYQPIQGKDEEFSNEYGLSGKFVVGYVGTHGLAHGLSHILSAAQLLRDREDIVFLFVGGGASRQELLEQVEKLKISNVIMINRQPKELIPRILSLCDISIVPLINTPLFATVIPSKIFECMGMGIPMVVSIPEGEATAIVRETGTGEIALPEDAEALCASVLKLKDNKDYYNELVSNCLRAAQDFSREALASRMLLEIAVCVESEKEHN